MLQLLEKLGTNDSKGQKVECEWSNSSILQNQLLNGWDRATFYEIEVSIQFVTCKLKSKLMVLLRQMKFYQNALHRFIATIDFVAPSLYRP